MSHRILLSMASAGLVIAPLTSEAGTASVGMHVSATVIANARHRVEQQSTSITITQQDIERGFVDAVDASRIVVTSNGGAGHQLDFYPVVPLFSSLHVRDEAQVAHLGADGGSVTYRQPSGNAAVRHALSYRFMLDSRLVPGTYPWPLMLQVRAL